MSKLHILVDSLEQSIFAARLYYLGPPQKKVDLVEVMHIRHKNFAEKFVELVRKAATNDQILISMDYIGDDQLKSATDQLSVEKDIFQEKSLTVTLISSGCFEKIHEWGNTNKFKYYKNGLKQRKTQETTKEKVVPLKSKEEPISIPNGPISPQQLPIRNWIQYRLMLAILSMQQMNDVAKDLITLNPSQDELSRSSEYYKLSQPDMVGGTYFGETEKGNVVDKLRRRINLIAATDYHVLIHGESGTGKETVAWAIHALSKRKDEPFVILNCAGFSDQLLESELFGHKKGAFTGADRDRDGILKTAKGGTVFLDELPEMKPMVQAKVLRLLNSGEYRPLGDDGKNIHIDVRFICAGQNHLLSDTSKVRPDLIARISQLSTGLPALRELNEDVFFKICSALLARYTWTTVKRHGKDHELTPKDIREYQDSLKNGSKNGKLLRNAEWKNSNVRELNNFIRQWLVFDEDGSYQLSSTTGEFDKENTQSAIANDSPYSYEKFAEYITPFNSLDELEQMFKNENFFENIKKAYMQYIFKRFQKIKPEGKQVDLAKIISFTATKLSGLLKSPQA